MIKGLSSEIPEYALEYFKTRCALMILGYDGIGIQFERMPKGLTLFYCNNGFLKAAVISVQKDLTLRRPEHFFENRSDETLVDIIRRVQTVTMSFQCNTSQETADVPAVKQALTLI